MSERQVEYEQFAIVVVGSFNPAIFHPLWFSKNNLIRPEEAETAKVEVVHNEVAQFSGEWLSMQVFQGRLTAETNDPTKLQPLRDIVLGTFQILRHTPVTAYGLNRHKHFRMLSESDFQDLGHYLAPKVPWAGALEKPLLSGLLMEGKRPDDDFGKIRIAIGPSAKAPFTVTVHVHEHRELGKGEGEVNATRFLGDFQTVWTPFFKYAEDAMSQLLSNFDNKVVK